MAELNPFIRVLVRDPRDRRVSGASVEFFVNGASFSKAFPTTVERDASIQITDSKATVNAVVKFKEFKDAKTFAADEDEWRCKIPLHLVESDLNILHITDLHAGQPQYDDYYLDMRRSLLRDLRYCASSTPWDLIIFSGDLSFSGQPLRQEKSWKGEWRCNLKPFEVIQRVRPPPGRGAARQPEASSCMGDGDVAREA